ncbi:sugar phosphate isomerase/epimerase family protein [Rhizobium sp. S152]|uniref:sugar phosphate isomerase/epimerase family protein n=1 Tax=Rhizobium sp. S152 TaxID=3055038 RepID=UPI0025A9849D|nr:sugar phosphate isomerase/epimerase family protein [Rhizobium sp. S152]MDM9625268.1 sugar phosphate isomerase/epimerase family protein [Rhizobium sp. S152]
MRLGGIAVGPQTIEEIGPFCEKADRYGISAIVAPKAIGEMSLDDASRFGERAREAGLVIGETGFWENIITTDVDVRADRLRRLRKVLANADAMQCRSVAVLAGTRDSSDKAFAAHAYMFTEECKQELRGVILQALEGFDSPRTRLGLEPYAHSFFYGPQSAADFIASVGHPQFGIHLDLANMIEPGNFFQTGELARDAFALLEPHIVSVHLKDLVWPVSPLGLRFEEVNLGDGHMDFDAYFKHIARLDRDITCFCEHFKDEEEYALNFEKAHQLASRAGFQFITRN